MEAGLRDVPRGAKDTAEVDRLRAVVAFAGGGWRLPSRSGRSRLGREGAMEGLREAAGWLCNDFWEGVAGWLTWWRSQPDARRGLQC